MNRNYSIIVQWSEQDRCFAAILPEWGDSGLAQGQTYEQALTNGQKAIDSLIKSFLANGHLLPEPQTFEVASPTQ
jgi:predicted RNase H-like HicB family nuclease